TLLALRWKGVQRSKPHPPAYKRACGITPTYDLSRGTTRLMLPGSPCSYRGCFLSRRCLRCVERGTSALPGRWTLLFTRNGPCRCFHVLPRVITVLSAVAPMDALCSALR